ncbi:hypothetical protein DFJ73DRAFT_943890 [Zopfochytrium polystomum]|nr:hypothetical protein DFJ73DRAFT_943890 [Zopfochytrium polystomum]
MSITTPIVYLSNCFQNDGSGFSQFAYYPHENQSNNGEQPAAVCNFPSYVYWEQPAGGKVTCNGGNGQFSGFDALIAQDAQSLPDFYYAGYAVEFGNGWAIKANCYKDNKRTLYSTDQGYCQAIYYCEAVVAYDGIVRAPLRADLPRAVPAAAAKAVFEAPRDEAFGVDVRPGRRRRRARTSAVVSDFRLCSHHGHEACSDCDVVRRGEGRGSPRRAAAALAKHHALESETATEGGPKRPDGLGLEEESFARRTQGGRTRGCCYRFCCCGRDRRQKEWETREHSRSIHRRQQQRRKNNDEDNGDNDSDEAEPPDVADLVGVRMVRLPAWDSPYPVSNGDAMLSGMPVPVTAAKCQAVGTTPAAKADGLFRMSFVSPVNHLPFDAIAKLAPRTCAICGEVTAALKMLRRVQGRAVQYCLGRLPDRGLEVEQARMQTPRFHCRDAGPSSSSSSE